MGQSIFELVFLRPQPTQVENVRMIEDPEALIELQVERIIGPGRQTGSGQDVVVQFFRESETKCSSHARLYATPVEVTQVADRRQF